MLPDTNQMCFAPCGRDTVYKDLVNGQARSPSAAVGRWMTAAALHIYLSTWFPQDNTSAKSFALVGDMCMLLVMRICDCLCDHRHLGTW